MGLAELERILVRIGPASSAGDYSVVIDLLNGHHLRGTILSDTAKRLRQEALNPPTTVPDPWGFGASLYSALLPPNLEGEIRTVVEQSRSSGSGSPLRLLLEIDAVDLRHLPWELAALNLPFGPEPMEVVRFVSRARPPAFRGLDLPLRLLLVNTVSGGTEGMPREIPFDLNQTLLKIFPTDELMLQTFRPTIVQGAGVQEIEALLRGGQYDVVHLVASGGWAADEEGTGVLVASEGDRIGPTKLARLLRTSQTRLLILHTPDWGAGKDVPLLDVAARVFSSGPPVLATRFPGNSTAAEQFYFRLYNDLVHDEPLDVAAMDARNYLRIIAPADPAWSRPALFLWAGAKELLRVSPLAARAATRADEMRQEVKQLLKYVEDLQRRDSLRLLRSTEVMDRDLDVRTKHLDDLDKQLEAASSEASEIQQWGSERRGLAPLGKARSSIRGAEAMLFREGERLRDLAEAAAIEFEQESGRVVNSAFFRDGRVLKPSESLKVGAKYVLRVQIGAPTAESHVRVPVQIPEVALAPLYIEGKVPVRILLYSDRFRLIDEAKELLLPRAGPSQPVRFSVVAPRRVGLAWLRVSIYYKHNLLQSLKVTVHITRRPQTNLPHGNEAHVEYALTGSLHDIERFSDRKLCVLTNETPDGTHVFAIAGTKLKRHFHIPEGTMRTAVDAARRSLLEVCSRLDHAGRPLNRGYRFDANNAGKEDLFVKDVVALAHFGQDLFSDFVTLKSRVFRKELREALGRSATIQVASTKSVKYAFPWALVYDKLLLRDRKNAVCPEFLRALREGRGKLPGFLAGQVCLTNGCPHEADTNVVCPSGFWGFKHIIEQPPSIAEEPPSINGPDGSQEAASSRTPTPSSRTETVLKITVRGKPALVMGAHNRLDLLPKRWAHRDKLKTLADMDFTDPPTKADIGKALRHARRDLIYFYCHGGMTGMRPWLGVGDDEQISPAELIQGWELTWDNHPLVFVNGCHTVDLTPDALTSFINTFAYCGAAGVIGTEVSIPESLAREVAVGFFERFLGGGLVGEILRAQRWALLEKYNLLGLIYTPYCSADLHMTITPTPTQDILMLEARRSPAYVEVATEAATLEQVWRAAGLRFRIVSNDIRYQPGLMTSKADFLKALRSEWTRIIHLAVHGDGVSLSLRWSDDPDVRLRQPVERLTVAEIEGLDLGNAIVVSGACSSGMETLVRAFLRAGARAYVAPMVDVEWSRLVPFFEKFYSGLKDGLSLRSALNEATAAVPQVGQHYQIFGDETVVFSS